jgi:hypothetical protein
MKCIDIKINDFDHQCGETTPLSHLSFFGDSLTSLKPKD